MLIVVRYITLFAGLITAWQAAMDGPYLRISAIVSALCLIAMSIPLIAGRN